MTTLTGRVAPPREGLLVEAWRPSAVAAAVPSDVPLTDDRLAALPPTVRDRVAAAFVGYDRTDGEGRFRIEAESGSDVPGSVELRVFDTDDGVVLAGAARDLVVDDGTLDAGILKPGDSRRAIATGTAALLALLAGCSALLGSEEESSSTRFGVGLPSGEQPESGTPGTPTETPTRTPTRTPTETPTQTPTETPSSPNDRGRRSRDRSDSSDSDPNQPPADDGDDNTPGEDSPEEEPPEEEPPEEEPPEEEPPEEEPPEEEPPEENPPEEEPPTEPEPAPEPVAPPLDQTTTTPFDRRVSYLYEGEDAVQTGLDPAALDADRVGVLTGVVRERGGGPLGGVTVRISDRPEFGETKTRADGRYDLVTNGGGIVVAEFARTGYLTAQRRVRLPWTDYRAVEPVTLVPDMAPPTPVTMGSSTGQVAEGAVETDADGPRRSVLYFPPGTTAVAGESGEYVPGMLDVRVVEYTVGEDGPSAMPGELPPFSAYTYAAEYTADYDATAAATGGTTRPLATLDGPGEIRFDRPVISYVDNFVGFPIGEIVPVGSYDLDIAAWRPERNGLVIAVLGAADGLARLDVDGSGAAADDAALQILGITEDELRTLADLYDPGTELWRVSIPHFTPWDCNWPYIPPRDARGPDGPDPRRRGDDELDTDDPCKQ